MPISAATVAPESLKMQMELGSPEALKGVVSTGLGFAIVSRAVVEKETQLGELVAIPLKPPLKRSLYLVIPAGSLPVAPGDFDLHRVRQGKLKELAL
jgi:DNA-binding transcriptional LysR family regulator